MWALVHSPMETDVRRGRALAQELLAGKQLEERSEHDCIYLLSVALYRAGRLLDARRQLDELLKVRPAGPTTSTGCTAQALRRSSSGV